MPILDDHRPITFLNLGETYYTTNERVTGLGMYVDSIDAYPEPGQGAYTAWFKIIVNNEIVARVNGAYVVSIEYGGE